MVPKPNHVIVCAIKSHAIHKRLVELEADIVTRIAKQDFRRRSAVSKPESGQYLSCIFSRATALTLSRGLLSLALTEEDTRFWRMHCTVVPLGVLAAEEAKRRKANGHKVYKPQTCHRCHTVKFAEGLNGSGNHKRKCCADGVLSKNPADPPPAFPQPAGIFKLGTEFNPIKFLEAVHRLNEYSVSEERMRTAPPELAAFAEMLDERKEVRIVPSESASEAGSPADRTVILFRLFDYLTCSPSCAELVEVHGGVRYLRMECLEHD